MITREYPPFIVGGIGTHTYHLVQALRGLGVKVLVVSFGNPISTKDDVVFLRPVSSILESRQTLLKDIRIPIDIIRMTIYAMRIAKKYDILHVQEPYVGGLILHPRKITTFHTTGLGEVKTILSNNKLNFHTFKRIIFYITIGLFMEIASLLTSKVIITPSYTAKKELINFYPLKPKKIIVIHNGIEPPKKLPTKQEARLYLQLPQDKIIILSVGRHIPIKQFDILIDAIRQISAEARNRILVLIAGEGPETGRIIKLVNTYGLQNTVKLIGKIPNEKLWIYYSASDIFVLTSVKESAPMVILEAGTAGNVIVTSRVGDYALMMQQRVDGITFKPGDVQTLAKILTELITNQHLRHQLSEGARRFAMRFTAEATAKRTLEVYKRLIW